jgi:hypothetical protein
MLDYLIVLVAAAIFMVLWTPRLAGSRLWRASITPLASIIGSGFLVLGPILHHSYGWYAPAVMAGLCLVAYLFGAAIRFNIQSENATDIVTVAMSQKLESISSATLGFAYFISVAYYLNLFGAFAVSLTEANTATNARLVTTAAFVAILFAGWTGGFKWLERLEYVTVVLKLSIIAGLLVGLAVFFTGKANAGALVFNAPQLSGFPALALAFGLIVTVQGFETSRYLGDEYDALARCRSMQLAQWISTLIYLVYILLLTYAFARSEQKLTETAVIGMMSVVAPVLPILLVAGALAAQFSAAVADTSGSGGLIGELTGGAIGSRAGYAILVAIGIALTWSVNVFQIISYASRAFAVYYALQAGIAATAAWFSKKYWRFLLFALLAATGAAIALLGQSFEG